jgi:hypothetical protein
METPDDAPQVPSEVASAMVRNRSLTEAFLIPARPLVRPLAIKLAARSRKNPTAPPSMS